MFEIDGVAFSRSELDDNIVIVVPSFNSHFFLSRIIYPSERVESSVIFTRRRDIRSEKNGAEKTKKLKSVSEVKQQSEEGKSCCFFARKLFHFLKNPLSSAQKCSSSSVQSCLSFSIDLFQNK